MGALKYMILIGLAIQVIEYIDPNNELISATKKKESNVYKRQSIPLPIMNCLFVFKLFLSIVL